MVKIKNRKKNGREKHEQWEALEWPMLHHWESTRKLHLTQDMKDVVPSEITSESVLAPAEQGLRRWDPPSEILSSSPTCFLDANSQYCESCFSTSPRGCSAMSGAAGWPDPDLTADPAEKARSKFARRKKDQWLKLSSLFFWLLLSKGQG